MAKPELSQNKLKLKQASSDHQLSNALENDTARPFIDKSTNFCISTLSDISSTNSDRCSTGGNSHLYSTSAFSNQPLINRSPVIFS